MHMILYYILVFPCVKRDRVSRGGDWDIDIGLYLLFLSFIGKNGSERDIDANVIFFF